MITPYYAPFHKFEIYFFRLTTNKLSSFLTFDLYLISSNVKKYITFLNCPYDTIHTSGRTWARLFIRSKGSRFQSLHDLCLEVLTLHGTELRLFGSNKSFQKLSFTISIRQMSQTHSTTTSRLALSTIFFIAIFVKVKI